MGWFVSVVAVLGLVLVSHHLGIDLTSAVGATLRGTEHFLGLPLSSL